MTTKNKAATNTANKTNAVRVLELFKGSGSVGKYLETSRLAKFDVVSLDIECKYDPTMCGDIMTWDYKKRFPSGHFDIIWASPPCTEYSIAKTRAPRDMDSADRIVLKTLEIIRYFRPRVWIMENPATGYLKTRAFMQGLPYYDVTYCKYGYPYRKATRLWTNLQGFEPKYCRKDCGMMIDGKHIIDIGGNSFEKHPWLKKTHVPITQKYSIPSELLHDMFQVALALMTL